MVLLIVASMNDESIVCVLQQFTEGWRVEKANEKKKLGLNVTRSWDASRRHSAQGDLGCSASSNGPNSSSDRHGKID